jgi:hypothetical protein
MTVAEGGKTLGTRLESFLRAVGYPERAPAGSAAFTLRVDGMEVLLEESRGRLVLSCKLTDDAQSLPALATYAAGRILREDAALSWGDGAFLWQEVPAGSGDGGMLRAFEAFMDSCDWWRARVDERKKGDSVEMSEAVIMP